MEVSPSENINFSDEMSSPSANKVIDEQVKEDGPGDMVVTDDFLQVLDEHRKICEKEGKLDEALAARKRLKELKIVNENRKRETVINAHTLEMESLEKAHLQEIKELLQKWNNIILPNFENESGLLELELKKR